MPRIRTAALAITLFALIAPAAQAQDKPRPDSNPPWKALTSSPAALKVVFDEICLTAILDQQSVETLAVQRHLIEVNAKTAGFSGDARVWRLASYGPVYVVAWGDGTCSATIERGDPEALKQQVLDAVAARGVTLSPGAPKPAKPDGVNLAYCSPPPQPLIVGVISPADKKSKRPAIFINVFKARSGQPSFCGQPALGNSVP